MNKETAAFMLVGGMVTGSIAAALKEIAKAEGVTVSELIRRAIAQTYGLDSGKTHRPGQYDRSSMRKAAEANKANQQAGNSHVQSQESQEAREVQAATS